MGQQEDVSGPVAQRAVRTGLIDAEAEVQLEPGQQWKKVREVVPLRS